jgi:hypothetical protein
MKALLFLVPSTLETATLQALNASGVFNTTKAGPAATRRLLASEELAGAWQLGRQLLQDNATNATNTTSAGNATTAGNATAGNSTASSGTNSSTSAAASTSNTAPDFGLPLPEWAYLDDYQVTEAVPDVSLLTVGAPAAAPLPPPPAVPGSNITLQPDQGDALQDFLANMTGTQRVAGAAVLSVQLSGV